MTKTLKVLPHMCDQQKDEIQRLLNAADDIGAAASSMNTQGGQGYTQLFEARTRFKEMLYEIMQRHRICLFEEDIHKHIMTK